MDKADRTFIVPSDQQLKSKRFYIRHVWRPALAQGLSRRNWLDGLTLLYEFEGRFFWRSGDLYIVPEIDTVFTDPDNRWYSDFEKADKSGYAPRQYCRVWERLRLMCLYCRVMDDPDPLMSASAHPPAPFPLSALVSRSPSAE